MSAKPDNFFAVRFQLPRIIGKIFIGAKLQGIDINADYLKISQGAPQSRQR